MLGRDPPARRAAVARQHPHADGLTEQPHHIGIVKEQTQQEEEQDGITTG